MGNREVKAEKLVNCLLVEGNDDRHVIWSLLKYYSIPKLFDVKEKGGIDAIVNDLDVELDNPGLTRLGVVVDIDTSLQDRWDALRYKLTKYGYKTVPMSPNAAGTIIVEADLPIVGIWLMPENMLPGMLEDFLHFLVHRKGNNRICIFLCNAAYTMVQYAELHRAFAFLWDENKQCAIVP